MTEHDAPPSFRGDLPAAAEQEMLHDRRELALVAVERTRMPMVITDPRQPDNPIVFANSAFLTLTGYSALEVLGRNCRFLQGPQTAPEDVDTIRAELGAGHDFIEIELLNYRKDGSTFWNQLAISAVHDDHGERLYYFASQKDVTSRRTAQTLAASEERLLKEVDHRALNALALVKSIVGLSSRSSVERFAQSVGRRVDALARAHRLLAQATWGPVALRVLLDSELVASPVGYSGPPTRLAPRLVQPLALVIHELAANAREHGVLSGGPGQLMIRWQELAGSLDIEWRESELSVSPSSAWGQGLGLRLARGIVEQQLRGTMQVTPQDHELTIRLVIPSEE